MNIEKNDKYELSPQDYADAGKYARRKTLPYFLMPISALAGTLIAIALALILGH